MRGSARIGAGVVLVGILLANPPRLLGQEGMGAAQPGMTGRFGSAGGPFGNPWLNPLWSPDPAIAGDPRMLALYALAEQQARWGIGSGRLSGLRSPGVVGRGGGAARPPAEMPRASSIPGGGAAGYFGRGPSTRPSGAQHFQRHNRYFSNNGR